MPTNRRVKHQAAPDAPRAISHAGRSRAELEILGQRLGFHDRELSAEDVANLSSDEYLWFEGLFLHRLEEAAQREKSERLNAERIPIWNTRRMWRGQATAEEDRLAREAANEFATRVPQFERTLENAKRIARYMEENDLDGTKVESYITSFRALVEDGTITPAPAKSADQYLAEHPELHDSRVPPIIQSQRDKAQATEEHFRRAREATATARAGATSFTDYPQEQRGMAPLSDIEKMSLRTLVRNMSAAELAEKCQNEPSFKKALDSLGV